MCAVDFKPIPDKIGLGPPRATARKARLFLAARLTRFSLPNQNIENNPMQSNKGSLAWMLYPRKHFDTSGKSPALFQHRATFKNRGPRQTGCSARLQAKNSDN